VEQTFHVIAHLSGDRAPGDEQATLHVVAERSAGDVGAADQRYLRVDHQDLGV
jgi:hypothetical protein